MKFKVGDIVIFDREKFDSFKEYLYNREHMVIQVKENGDIRTTGYGWEYEDHGDTWSSLITSKENQKYLSLVNKNSWRECRLTYKFI